jgi:2-polyprenyl-3-methyl-5-hydroxy-6-metoxy-1,4-benzoquinol methylase
MENPKYLTMAYLSRLKKPGTGSQLGIPQGKRNSYEFKIQLPTILNLLGRLHKKDLLDIGCGPAVYLAEFARSGANTLGVDLSRRMLDTARAQPTD